MTLATTKNPEQTAGSNDTLNEFHSTLQLTSKKGIEYEDDYHPFTERVVEKPNSTAGSLIHLLKSSLGTGVLAMPMAFSNAGLVFGGVGTIVVGFLCTYCVHILVKTSHDVCKKIRVPSLGFAETAEMVFLHGPEGARKYSRAARHFVDYALMATYFGAACVYIVFIAKSFSIVINYQANIDIDVRVWIAIILVPMLLMGQFRELKYLVPCSALANLFIIITFGITLYYIFEGALVYSDKPLMANVKSLPYFFSTVIFAMEGIGVVMPVENSMKQPQHFLGCPGVLNTAMIVVVTLYAVIGFFGFVKFGDEVSIGSITLNLPQTAVAETAKILMALAILLTFGLQYYVPIDILWRKIKHRVPQHRQNIVQIAIRSGIIIVLAALAVAVPELEPFIGLVGAVFFSTLGLLVPSVVETVFLWDNLGKYNWVLWKNMILGIFAMIALVTGAYVSIEDIVHLYSKTTE